MTVEGPVEPTAEPPAGSPVAAALRLYGSHWQVLVACTLVGVIPVVALDTAEYLRSGVDPFAAAELRGADGTDSALSWLALGVSLALYSLVTAACVRVTADALAGRPADWRSALGAGANRTVGVLLASLIVTIGVAFGLLALIIPGIWLAVSWSVASPAVVLEGASPAQAVKRSFGLVRGSWWYAFGTVALAALTAIAIVIAVAIPVTLAMQAVESQAGRVALFAVTETIVMAVLLPFGAAVVTILYLQLRARHGDRPGGPDGGDLDGRRHYAPPLGAEGRFGGFEPPTSPEPR